MPQLLRLRSTLQAKVKLATGKYFSRKTVKNDPKGSTFPYKIDELFKATLKSDLEKAFAEGDISVDDAA